MLVLPHMVQVYSNLLTVVTHSAVQFKNINHQYHYMKVSRPILYNCRQWSVFAVSFAGFQTCNIFAHLGLGCVLYAYTTGYWDVFDSGIPSPPQMYVTLSLRAYGWGLYSVLRFQSAMSPGSAPQAPLENVIQQDSVQLHFVGVLITIHIKTVTWNSVN